MHLLLGIGIADLDMPGRGVLGKAFGRGRYPVDTVFAHTAPAHDDQLARRGGFFVAWLTIHGFRHNPQSGHKNQGLAHVSGIKQGLTKGRLHPAFIPPVLNPFNNPVKQTPGVKGGL